VPLAVVVLIVVAALGASTSGAPAPAASPGSIDGWSVPFLARPASEPIRLRAAATS
jgi:hypothetical protein